jgi:vitamin B12 transporter
MGFLKADRRVAYGAALAAGMPVFAQGTPPAALEPVVVTGARIEQRLDQTLPSTTLLTRADIERDQATDLVELLARQAGVQFARAGGPGGQSSLFVRGAGSGQVLVLIDGVPVNTSQSGAAVLGGVQLDTIERIEIARGNLSSLYGSSAIGGVIQIFTRGGGRTGATLAAEVGSGSYGAASAAWGRAWGGGRIDAAAAYRASRPFSAIDTAQVVPGPFAPGANDDIDGNRSRSASLQIEHAFSDAVTLGASGWAQRNDTDFDSTADGPQASHREVSKADVARAWGRVAFADGSARLTAAQARERSSNRSSEPASFSNGDFDSRNRQLALDGEVAPFAGLRATVGGEFLGQRAAATSYDATGGGAQVAYDRHVLSARAGLIVETPPHQVQLNVRTDDYSDVGAATTGLVAYAFRWSAAWRVRAQWSNAFRAPSFNDLYFPGFGNPDLRPEKASSIEAGLAYGEGAMEAEVALFGTRTRDLIVYDPATNRAANIARALARGAELTVTWRREAWRLSGNATYLYTEDESTGERLPRRAPWLLNLSAFYGGDAWSLGGEVGHTAQRDDFDLNTFARTRLAPYTLVRLLATYRIAAAVTLKLRVENAFDEHYELVDGYNTPRRGAFVGVEARL